MPFGSNVTQISRVPDVGIYKGESDFLERAGKEARKREAYKGVSKAVRGVSSNIKNMTLDQLEKRLNQLEAKKASLEKRIAMNQEQIPDEKMIKGNENQMAPLFENKRPVQSESSGSVPLFQTRGFGLRRGK